MCNSYMQCPGAAPADAGQAWKDLTRVWLDELFACAESPENNVKTVTVFRTNGYRMQTFVREL